MSHQIEWEVDKTALLQASQHKEKDPNNPRKTIPIQTITITDRTITPSSSHKFLGVSIIDDQLRFREQLAAAAAKGTRYAAACRRFAKPSIGIKLRHMRQLFASVIVLKMLYAVDVWGAEMLARQGGKAGSTGLGKILERVLRSHALTSTGAMSTTSTELTVAHANITPLPFLIRRICFRSYARMSTLPSANPIYKAIRLASRLRKRHRSPLHHLAAAFSSVRPKAVEEIKALRYSPKWKPLTSITIDEDTDDAITRAQEADEEVQIFTDGSGINDNIGAVAILRRQGQPDKILHFHLGSKTHYTVYNGKQIGMLLGAEVLRREPNVRSVYMGVDNQAAIMATVSRNCYSGHALTDLFLQTLEPALRKNNLHTLSVRWVPGHANIAGNE